MNARCVRCRCAYLSGNKRQIGYCPACNSLRKHECTHRDERLRNGERIDVDWSDAPIAARYGVL